MALADFKLHEWLLNQGTGNTVPESIGGLDMAPISGHSTQWGTDEVFGENRSFLTLGYSYYTTTSILQFGYIVNNTGLAAQLNSWTICFVGRHLMSLNVNTFWGCFIRVGNAVFRTWNGNIDRVVAPSSTGTVLANSGQLKWGEWAKYVITCDGVNVRTYVNDMTTPVSTTAALPLSTGQIRFGSFQDTSNPGSMELANVTICNSALSESERIEYINQFGQVPSVFSFSKYDMSDFGGFLRWPEEDATTHDRSYVDVEQFEGTDVFKMSADYASGGSCQAAVVRRIKSGMTKFYKRASLFLPTNFDCNWFFGDTFNVFSLWEDYPHFGADIFAVQLIQYVEGTGPLYIHRLLYRNTVSGLQAIELGDIELTKGVWHDFFMYADTATGEISLIIDGVEFVNTTVLLDRTPNCEYNGIYLGIHPQNAGNYFYMRDLHIGEIDYVPPVPPVPPTPPPTPTPTPTPEEPYKAIFKAACIVDSTGEPIRW